MFYAGSMVGTSHCCPLCGSGGRAALGAISHLLLCTHSYRSLGPPLSVVAGLSFSSLLVSQVQMTMSHLNFSLFLHHSKVAQFLIMLNCLFVLDRVS